MAEQDIDKASLRVIYEKLWKISNKKITLEDIWIEQSLVTAKFTK